MQINGERIIKARIATVWAALNNADILKQSIPGCDSLEGDFTNGFTATIKQKIGPVSATFQGKVSISDVVDGKSYKISGEGDGGVAGKASGGAAVALSQNGDGTTLLTYEVSANISGKIMQLGSRIIEPVVKKCSDQFFDKFNSLVEEEVMPAPMPALSADSMESEKPLKKSWWKF